MNGVYINWNALCWVFGPMMLSVTVILIAVASSSDKDRPDGPVFMTIWFFVLCCLIVCASQSTCAIDSAGPTL